MNLPIEIIGVGGIVLIFMIFTIWKVFSQIILKWRYKPANDKSRLGEEKRRQIPEVDTTVRRIGAAKSTAERRDTDVQRPAAIEKREPVQTTVVNKTGQNRSGTGKSSIRFIRRRT